MEVTEVRISPAKGGKVRAFASVVFDDCFIVNDLRVIEGREGQVFVTMPARKTRNGQMRDIAHPLDSATREMIETKVLEEFATAVDNRAVPDRAAKGGGKDGQAVGHRSSVDQTVQRRVLDLRCSDRGERQGMIVQRASLDRRSCAVGRRVIDPESTRNRLYSAALGASASGKPPVFGSGIRRFESCRPSHEADSSC